MILTICMWASCAPASPIITEQPVFTIARANQSSIAHFPFIHVSDSVQVVTWSQHEDAVIFPSTDGVAVSTSLSGIDWFSAQGNYYLTCMTRLNNGDLFGISYATQRVDDQTEQIYSWRSRDGLTWSETVGLLHMPRPQLARTANWGGFVMHRSCMLLQGTLYALAYGNYADDISYRVLWLRSEDEGRNWQIVSTVASDETGRLPLGYCEPTAVYGLAGLTVLMRTGGYGDTLYQTVSRDLGQTWTIPVEIPLRGMDPDIALVRGVGLVALVGTPKLELWSLKDSVWQPLHTPSIPHVWGYGGVRQVRENRLLIVSDADAETQIVGQYLDLSF